MGTRAVGFGIIWAALLIYAGEGLRLSASNARCLRAHRSEDQGADGAGNR